MEYEYCSVKVNGKDIGLPWLEKLTVLDNRSAVYTPWHSHAGMEILFFLKGELKYEFSTHQPQVVSGGMFLIIPREIRHRIFHKIGAPAKRMSFYIRPRLLGDTVPFPMENATTFQIFRQELRRHSFRPLPSSRALQANVNTLAAFLLSKRTDQDALAMARVRVICASILCSCLETCRGNLAVRRTDGNLMAETVQFLREHYAERLTVRQLVTHIGYGRSQLFTLFRQYTGMTPNNYLLRYRLKCAQKLLKETSLTTIEICHRIGIHSLQYFHQVFKQYTGFTPANYRHGASGADNTNPNRDKNT